MTLEQWEKLSITIVSFVTVLAIIGGGLFALIEYYDHKADGRKKISLALVSDYHSKEYREYRENIDEAWEVGHPVLISALTKEKCKSRAYNKYVVALVSEEKLSNDVGYIMDFFERVATCVNSDLCDKQIIDKFFKKSGRTFFRKYYPYVCNLRNKWQDNSIWSNTEVYFNPGGVNKICKKQRHPLI